MTIFFYHCTFSSRGVPRDSANPTPILRALDCFTGYPRGPTAARRETSEGGGWTGRLRQAAGTAELAER